MSHPRSPLSLHQSLHQLSTLRQKKSDRQDIIPAARRPLHLAHAASLAVTVSQLTFPKDDLFPFPRSSHPNPLLHTQPSTFWKQITVRPPSRNSHLASALPPSTSTSTVSQHPHPRQSAPVFPAAPTATLPAPPAPSATTAPQARLWAVLVNATASPALGTVSSWTVEDHDVVTVTILTLAVLRTRKSFPPAPAATVWSSADE